jgi:hypothetical protein
MWDTMFQKHTNYLHWAHYKNERIIYAKNIYHLGIAPT